MLSRSCFSSRQVVFGFGLTARTQYPSLCVSSWSSVITWFGNYSQRKDNTESNHSTMFACSLLNSHSLLVLCTCLHVTCCRVVCMACMYQVQM